MRLFRTSLCLAALMLIALQFAFPTHSRADSYNIVALAPDVAAVFPDSEAVNEALRALVKIALRNGKPSTAK